MSKLVATDSGDFSARTKLRLLRVTRCANAEGFLWQMGIMISTSSVVDVLLYRFLGDGSEHSRLTLKTLLDEASSPISVCQVTFLRVLVFFSEAAEFWVLFKELGGASSAVRHAEASPEHKFC